MTTEDITRKLNKLGWHLTRTGKNHIKATPPDNGPFVIFSSTPSDFRAGHKAMAVLRRYGHRIT